jgi:hypothetical protein
VIMFATINNYVGYPPQAYRVLYLLCFYTLLSFQLSAPVVKNAGSPAVLFAEQFNIMLGMTIFVRRV